MATEEQMRRGVKYEDHHAYWRVWRNIETGEIGGEEGWVDDQHFIYADYFRDAIEDIAPLEEWQPDPRYWA